MNPDWSQGGVRILVVEELALQEILMMNETAFYDLQVKGTGKANIEVEIKG